MQATYWVAGHLTAFFSIFDGPEDLLYKGSEGTGFSLDRGVLTDVRKEQGAKDHNRVFFDQVQVGPGVAEVTENVLSQLKPLMGTSSVSVRHTFQVPMGSGFGASAAGAVGTAFAVRDALELALDDLSTWQVAHKAEVQSRAGLGDVLGLYQQERGLELRVKAGAPGVGEVRKIVVPDSYNLYTVSFGPLSTKSVLGDHTSRQNITRQGNQAMRSFYHQPTFENFLTQAAAFCKAIGLASPQVLELIDLAEERGGHASQIMLGDGLFLFSGPEVDLSGLATIPLRQETLTPQSVRKISPD